MHSARILTDGSGETASTLKIVSDVARTSTCRWIDNDEAAGWAASSRELAFRLLYIRRPGAGIRRLCTPGRKVGGLFEKARGDVRIRGGHCKLEKGCRLFRQIFLARHNLVPATTRYYPSPLMRLRTAAESVPDEKYKSELKAGLVSRQARYRLRRRS
jgi:hypothetical protein